MKASKMSPVPNGPLIPWSKRNNGVPKVCNGWQWEGESRIQKVYLNVSPLSNDFEIILDCNLLTSFHQTFPTKIMSTYCLRCSASARQEPVHLTRPWGLRFSNSPNFLLNANNCFSFCFPERRLSHFPRLLRLHATWARGRRGETSWLHCSSLWSQEKRPTFHCQSHLPMGKPWRW